MPTGSSSPHLPTPANHPVAAAAGSRAGVRTIASTASPPAGDRFIVCQRSTVNVTREISAAAARLQAPADPGAVQHVQVAIDSMDITNVRPFWQAVLGYAVAGDEDLFDAHRQGPTFWFQQMDSPRTGRNRFHIDIYVPHDRVQARIDAPLAAGRGIVSDAHAPCWWSIADPEGNEADLAIWG